jgi:hypothetical protein
MYSPIGPCSRAISASVTSNSFSRSRRFALFAREPRRADVERGRLQRLHQRKVVELGSCVSAITAQRSSGSHDDRIVGHCGGRRRAGNIPCFAILGARIANRNL